MHWKGKIKEQGGGKRGGKEEKRKEKNHDETQSRLKYGLLTF